MICIELNWIGLVWFILPHRPYLTKPRKTLIKTRRHNKNKTMFKTPYTPIYYYFQHSVAGDMVENSHVFPGFHA